jgi:hypothetical protein
LGCSEAGHMKRTLLKTQAVVWAVFGAMLISFAAQAQPHEIDVAERIRLREVLRVPAATKISLQPTLELPLQRSLKVHLGFGLDFEVRNNLARWLERWNTQQGRKYGQLELVDDLAAAQIILAGFRDSEWTLTTLTHYPNQNAGPTELTPSTKESFTPIYGYIILPTGEELRVLRRIRYDEKRPPHNAQGKDAGSQLRNAFFRLLKQRQSMR